MMNDYELVLKAKSDQKYAVQLFNQYEPLIHSMFKNFKKINRHSQYEFEDYLSESYIVLLKTLPRVDLDQINNPEKWKFMHFYKQSLEWKNYAFNHFIEQKNNMTINFSCYSTSSDSTDKKTDLDFLDFLNHTSNELVPNEVINTLCIENFKERLNTQELQVLSFYLGKNDRMKTPTLKEIGEKMGLSKQRISIIVQNMKSKWQKIEKEV
jgi:RNA polymerase sigma factor (sigma-70 family)